MKELLYSEPRVTGARLQAGKVKDVVGGGAGKERSGRIGEEGVERVKVHSTPFVISRSGRRTGQGSWGLCVLLLSLDCRSVGSHV